MKELFTNMLQVVGLAWWVKIDTQHPRCTYYFGPFVSKQEATTYQSGYIEDLTGEKAQGITVEILRCKKSPEQLTVFDEVQEEVHPKPTGIPTLIVS